MKKSKRQQRMETMKKTDITITSNYSEMYPLLLKSIENGIKPVVITNNWEHSDISITKAREILKRYACDEWPMLRYADEFTDAGMKELIDLYEENKFWYGFSKHKSRDGLEMGYSEEELMKDWMISNFKNQYDLSNDMGDMQVNHLSVIIESYLLMGDKFAEIALKNFKLQ
jgi:SRSO17 transposase